MKHNDFTPGEEVHPSTQIPKNSVADPARQRRDNCDASQSPAGSPASIPAWPAGRFKLVRIHGRSVADLLLTDRVAADGAISFLRYKGVPLDIEIHSIISVLHSRDFFLLISHPSFAETVADCDLEILPSVSDEELRLYKVVRADSPATEQLACMVPFIVEALEYFLPAGKDLRGLLNLYDKRITPWKIEAAKTVLGEARAILELDKPSKAIVREGERGRELNITLPPFEDGLHTSAMDVRKPEHNQ